MHEMLWDCVFTCVSRKLLNIGSLTGLKHPGGFILENPFCCVYAAGNLKLIFRILNILFVWGKNKRKTQILDEHSTYKVYIDKGKELYKILNGKYIISTWHDTRIFPLTLYLISHPSSTSSSSSFLFHFSCLLTLYHFQFPYCMCSSTA